MELGVMINIYEETDIPAAFWYATEAGFRRGQVTSFIHGITADEVRQIAVAARNSGFQVDAVGCYINPLRPEDAGLHGVDGLDWQTLAENMGMMNGVERLVCWSGTLGRDAGRAQPAERRRGDVQQPVHRPERPAGDGCAACRSRSSWSRTAPMS